MAGTAVAPDVKVVASTMGSDPHMSAPVESPVPGDASADRDTSTRPMWSALSTSPIDSEPDEASNSAHATPWSLASVHWPPSLSADPLHVHWSLHELTLTWTVLEGFVCASPAAVSSSAS